MRYISPHGKRQDAAFRYLHPRLQDNKHPNLHVLIETQVVRILFESKRAVGVEYRPNPRYRTRVSSSHPLRRVRARKLVIVSCEALGTLPVLKRSGIGNPEILGRASVPLIADIPGLATNIKTIICWYICTNLV